MEWTTHSLSGMVAGFAVTGGDWKGAVAGGIAGMVPDIDEPRSHIGRPFFFLAIPINKIFGHRTLTHSLLFTVVLGFILWPFLSSSIVLGTVAGMLAHISGDMVTGKVKFLYPLQVSIGIPVSRFNYLLIDRITRLGLGVIVLWGIGSWIFSYFNFKL
ncbi:metal-dependent hydrolase [Lentibacillus salinarum]|uniref:Metal-dependent hydrolase n=1 Tax=Lentibacillus salinarum TaxID=446820 RepID=A0ABW3ZWT7_9BACI